MLLSLFLSFMEFLLLSKYIWIAAISKGRITATICIDMENQTEQLSYERIANMSRDELISYLIENCHELTRHMPTGKERLMYQSSRTSDMRELAFEIYRNSLVSCII